MGVVSSNLNENTVYIIVDKPKIYITVIENCDKY